MDFVAIFDVSLDSSTIYLFVLVGVELPLCVVVTLPLEAKPVSYNLFSESKIVLFY